MVAGVVPEIRVLLHVSDDASDILREGLNLLFRLPAARRVSALPGEIKATYELA